MIKKQEKNNNLEFQINPSRLSYLLELYKLSKENFIEQLQGKNKNPTLNLEELNEILNNNRKVNISFLRKLDKIFDKGITWYISNRDLPIKEKLSIFFRKDSFNANLNMGSIKLINEFEKRQIEIATLCNYISYKAERKYKYTIDQDSQKASIEIRKEFENITEKLKTRNILKKIQTDRDYLENLIRTIEEFNVFIFEFVDIKKKEDSTASFSGFFINPNMIVIKRQQDSIKREIFTLIHEFAHYLLGEEEIDTKVDENSTNLNKTEQWCNNFAYFFLIQDEDKKLREISEATAKNNFHRDIIDAISKKTYLSNLALYTRLRINNNISLPNYDIIYNKIMDTVFEDKKKRKAELKLQQEKDKEAGKKPFASSPKPIESRLFKEIVRINYFEGNINEARVMETLRVKNKLFEEVIYS